MSRSLYKLPFLSREVIKKSVKKKWKRKKNITFFQRNTKVPFSFIKKNLNIHQGLFFKSYNFYKMQVGLRLGEFTFTRRKPNHKKKANMKVSVTKTVKKRYNVKTFNLKKNGFFI